MTAKLVTLRDGIETAINAAKLTYVITNFNVEASWVPRETLEGLATDHPFGKVYIIGMGADDEPNQTRTNLCKKEIPVMVGLQRVLTENPESSAGKTLIDTLVELEEQLRETCRKHDPENFSWQRTEALKDDDGTPFSFMGLREANVFEAYFTVFFTTILN